MMKKLPIIEFHILQSFPVSCLNRDDLGSPKSAIIGGFERARVSSQCWKRAVRMALHESGVRLGIRTKKVKEEMVKAISLLSEDPDAAEKCAEAIAKCLSDDSLLFLSDLEYQTLADYAQSKKFEAGDVKDKEVYKLLKKARISAYDGLDIALFGRMVAKATTMNVEASVAFSHAISTHSSSTEVDFFTALDDLTDNETEAGAGHMGTLEFNSATYYRYVSLNLKQLADTLGIDDPKDLREPVAAFIKALYLAVPSARQATMSATNSWDYAKVYLRTGQRQQCTFERPVRAPREGGYLAPSIEALKSELDKKEMQAGSLFGKIAAFEFGGDEKMTIDELIEKVQSHLGE